MTNLKEQMAVLKEKLLVAYEEAKSQIVNFLREEGLPHAKVYLGELRKEYNLMQSGIYDSDLRDAKDSLEDMSDIVDNKDQAITQALFISFLRHNLNKVFHVQNLEGVSGEYTLYDAEIRHGATKLHNNHISGVDFTEPQYEGQLTSILSQFKEQAQTHANHNQKVQETQNDTVTIPSENFPRGVDLCGVYIGKNAHIDGNIIVKKDIFDTFANLTQEPSNHDRDIER